MKAGETRHTQTFLIGDKMHANKLFKILRTLQKQMQEKHPSLNYGGCGVFAHLVARKIEKSGLKVEIITPCDDYSKPANAVRDNIREVDNPNDWDNNGLCLNHLALRFITKSGVTYTYDSNVLYKGSDKFGNSKYKTNPEFGTGLFIHEVEQMTKAQRGWNRCFNRREIPAIKRKINALFDV